MKMESQSVFQAETQAKMFFIEFPSCARRPSRRTRGPRDRRSWHRGRSTSPTQRAMQRLYLGIVSEMQI